MEILPMHTIQACKRGFYVAAAILGLCGPVFSYTVVTIPPTLESGFIQETTAQYLGTVVTNPFFPNTYELNLTAINPAYNPPVTDAQLLNALIYKSSWTYLNGFGDGLDTQRETDEGIAGDVSIACSTPSALGWYAQQAETSNCVADMATAAAAVTALASSCTTSAEETAVFGSSVTATVNTVGCSRIIPVIAAYVAALSSGCVNAPATSSTTIADVGNCQLIANTIENTIYNTEFDSSTWLSPALQ